MNIHLKNIGIIQNSTICLDGLTVITGKNSSGKTTVGKVLYALIDSTNNINLKSEQDKIDYVNKTIDEVRSTLNIFRKVTITFFNSDSAFGRLLSSESYKHIYNEEFAHELYQELLTFDVVKFVNSTTFHEGYLRIFFRTQDKRKISEVIEDNINRAIFILEHLFNMLESDPELTNYTRESINQTLNVEFSGQINPVNHPELLSFVELYDDDYSYFKLKIVENQVSNEQEPIFIESPYNKVFFVDDPFILDKPTSQYLFNGHIEHTESVLNTRRILTHNTALARILRGKKNTTVFEDYILSYELGDIETEINKAIPGTVVFNDDGEFYVQDNKKLKFSNLATGSKVFSIIKMLLKKGLIDKNTLLILDEPESHLHPNWQNIFAEVIVLLVAKLDVKVLLTTHSSNFMLAIDAYMRKHSINNKCNFYQTEHYDNGFVNYKCVNDNMGEIYGDFMEYFSQVKMLRDKYIKE